MIEDSIIFIGPMGVGKTSVAKKVSETLGIKYIGVDELRWPYFEKQKDYDNRVVDKFFAAGNDTEAFSYMKPFEARLAVDFLQDMSKAVIDYSKLKGV